MKLKVSIKKIIKNAIIISLCIASIASSILTCMPIARADSSDMLGTKAALGSPLLNESFVIDDWNKWEMICWGVYLSNFCVPLIDDYNSAFRTGAGGTDGRGLKALCFGSGSDPANNKVVTSLCDSAIANQTVNSREIYVRYEAGNTGSNYPSDYRQATFRDLFFQIPYNDGDSKIFDTDYTSHTFGASSWTEENKVLWWDGPVGVCRTDIDGYCQMEWPSYVNLPTFYIKDSSNNFVKIFDYCNSWDVQMMGLILNSVPDEYMDKFMEEFKTLFDANNTITLDSFANITVNGKIVIPASVNQHITKDDKINLLNSFVFNGYINTLTESDIILGTRQLTTNPTYLDSFWDYFNKEYYRFSGGPAISSTTYGTVALMYYDTDSIVVQDYLFKDNNVIDYGDILKKLFDCNITNKQQTYPLKIELASGDTKSLSFASSSTNDKYIAVLQNTRYMANSMGVYNLTDKNQSKSVP